MSEASGARMSGQQGRPCVLVVDDEPLNRELLGRLLGREYEVVEAESVDQALAVLDRRGADVRLVICDQVMPGRFGTELAAEVAGRGAACPVVLLTGYEDDGAVRAAAAAGTVAGVIAKPWKGSDLRALIRSLLPPVPAG